MNPLLKEIRIFKSIFLISLKETSAYRSSLLFSVLSGPLGFIIQYFIWTAIYTKKEVINNMSFTDLLTYYGCSLIIGYLIWDSVNVELQDKITSGNFVVFLIKPISYKLYAFYRKLGQRSLAFFLEALPVAFIIAIVFQINIIPSNLLWTILSIFFSFIIMFQINFCVGIIGFWIVRTQGISTFFSLFRDLLAGAYLPLVFFPSFIQKILFFLPFQFITYVPTRVFIGSYELAGISMSIPSIVGMQGIYIFLLFVLTYILWKVSIKRFTGVGV